MAVSNKHIINKVFLEVNTHSEKKAFYLRDHLDLFLKEELLPLLLSYFDSFNKALQNNTIQFEKLDLNLVVSEDFDFNEIKSEFTQAIKEKIPKNFPEAKIPSKESTFVSSSKKQQNIFFHFLKTGSLPWWSRAEDADIFRSKESLISLATSVTFIDEFKRKLVFNTEKVRLIKQFDDIQLSTLIELLQIEESKKAGHKLFLNIPHLQNIIYSGTGRLKPFTLPQRNLTWNIILSIITSDKDNSIYPKLTKLISSLISANYRIIFPFTEKQIELVYKDKTPSDILSSLEETVERLGVDFIKVTGKHKKAIPKGKKSQVQTVGKRTPISPLKASQDKDPILDFEAEDEVKRFESILERYQETGTEYFIENAGLIILHPFFRQLFSDCNLLNENNQLKSPELATHLLHYLATGKERQFEHLMLFEKYLCNLSFSQSINRNLKLPSNFKKNANELLESVLEHWPSMQDASTELLRNEFLRRPGKISFENENPKIIIEKKTQDILLDKLPWSFSIVKLEWLDQIIFVDW